MVVPGSARNNGSRSHATVGRRDRGCWARAVIAESYERIHRSKLRIGMGILPLQFKAGETAEALGLTGEEIISISGVANAIARTKAVAVRAARANGTSLTFTATVRIDTPKEVEYYRHGGILEYVLRQLAGLASRARTGLTADQRNAILAGFLGWMLDAFDFFLVVMSLTAIAREFNKPDTAVAFAVAVTLAFRPVGAFIFGLLADRYGRRGPLMLNLVFYSVMSVLSGLAPNYTSFLVLRALFGIGMGGEWGVGASLVMEKVPPKWRGMISGLLQQGYAAGYLLAAVCYFLVFPRFGWRPLFFIGGLPALLALFVRMRVKESEVWHKTKEESWSHLGRAIGRHWKTFLYLTLLMAGMNFVSHGTQDMYPTFLQRDWGFSPQKRAALTAFSMVGAIFGGRWRGWSPTGSAGASPSRCRWWAPRR